MFLYGLKMADAPECARIIRAADAAYRKRIFSLSARDTVTIDGTFWDEGSRSTYTAVDIATGRASAAPQYAPPQFGGPRVAPAVPVPPGVAIVRTGISSGKTATACIYLNPADLAPMLPGSARMHA